MGNRSTKLRAYWRQVHAVQRKTGASSATARAVTRELRASNIRSAYATRRLGTAGLQSTARRVEREAREQNEPPTPKSLRDWRRLYEAGEYDDENPVDIEGAFDYE